MPSVTYQQTLGWGNPGTPGSAQERLWRERNLRKAEAVKTVKTVWVHKAVLVHFNALLLFLQKNDAKLGQRVDDWGFANRDIRGFTGIKSYHAWGLAIDVDAVEHPLGVRNTTFPVKRTHEVCRLLGMRWGLDYTGRPDPMHFEFMASRLRAKYIKSRLRKPTKRSRRLAELCGMDVKDFIARIG